MADVTNAVRKPSLQTVLTSFYILSCGDLAIEEMTQHLVS